MKTINDYAELVKEKHALNKTIAPVETDLTDASRGYHIGEQFIIDGGLFKAKTEIAQHDALVLNTNYEPADNLTEQIKNAGGGTGTDPRLDVFENNIAPVETDETDASRAYQVGEQLILSNILYDVIAPISEHDIITATGSGANIAPADPISSQFQTLTQKTDDIEDNQRYNGCFNLCPNNLTSQTFGGVQFTVNADKSITMTPTASVTGGGINIFEDSNNPIVLEKDAILYFGNNTYPASMEIIATYSDDTSIILNSSANKATLHSGNIKRVRIYITNAFNQTMTLYPMISYYDGTYVPNAKTNRELTKLLKPTGGSGTLNSDYFDTSDSSNVCIYHKFGAVIQGNFTAKVKTGATIPNANAYLASGLPKEIDTTIMAHAYDVTDNTNYKLAGQVRISNGNINYPFNQEVSAGTRLRILFVYIAESM